MRLPELVRKLDKLNFVTVALQGENMTIAIVRAHFGQLLGDNPTLKHVEKYLRPSSSTVNYPQTILKCPF